MKCLNIHPFRKIIVAYNAEFDERLLRQTATINKCKPLINDWECAMIPYAAYVGKWSGSKGDYTWQKLPDGDHSAVGDCLATLKLLEKMAAF